MISSYFLSTRPHEPIPLWVNVSGRYDMTRILQRTQYKEDFERQGYQDWHVTVAGKKVVKRMTPAEIQACVLLVVWFEDVN